nr:MAG TPA: hypothetical protein [Ackermannviridae sp.]
MRLVVSKLVVFIFVVFIIINILEKEKNLV